MIIMKTKHIKNQSALVMASALFIGSASFLTAQEVTIGGDAIEDASDPGNALTGDMIVEGDATVNGSLFVQPDSAPVAPVDSVSSTGTAGVPPSIQDNGDGTSTVFTGISTVDVDRVANTAGGVQLDANGDVTLTPGETTTSQLRYGIFEQVDVDTETNDPIGPPTYVAGIVDEDGNLVSILAGVAVDTADEDSLNWTIDLNDPLLNVNDILIDSQVTTNDGNLTVGGNAEIAGSLKVDGVDVATVTDIDDAFDAQALVDAAQDQAIATEIADRTALIRREADGLIHIGDNSMIYDDTQAGSDRLTSSKSLLILGGGATTDIQVDANLEVLGDATFRQNVFVDGDIFVGGRAQGLQAQTDANTAAIANNRRDIEKNRRGIAMVAAMTQSTVLPGMTHALDANVAHFEGKTGMAVSYSRRINENVQLNLAGASTTDFKESVIRGGIGVQW